MLKATWAGRWNAFRRSVWGLLENDVRKVEREVGRVMLAELEA